jgi:pilus assembly protein Flp/PilA
LRCRRAFVVSRSYFPIQGTTTILIVNNNFIKNDDGATAIEYGLIAALIAVAAVTVMGTVGTNLSSTFNTVAGAL